MAMQIRIIKRQGLARGAPLNAWWRGYGDLAKRKATPGRRNRLDGILQFFAGFEFNDIFGLDLNCFTRLGVPAFAGFAAHF